MDTLSIRALEVLNDVYNIDQLISGKDYIRELVHRLAQILHVKYVMVGHAVEPQRQDIQSDFLWSQNSFTDNVVYPLDGSPCSDVICGTRVACYPHQVRDFFPRDRMLSDLHADSYVGAPFLNTDGSLIGLLVVMDDKPLDDRELYTAVVEFFAARIGTEYRRLAVEDSLKRINESLERLVDERARDLQKAFDSLQVTQRQLLSQEKLATLGRITFGIAHELKNPLNIIINAAELLQEKDLDMTSARKAAEMIYQQGLRANEIITSMLKQARQEETAEPERISISEMLDHAVEFYVRSLPHADLKSVLVVKKKIAPQVYVSVRDPASIERMLINIIDNALYALEEKLKRNIPGYVPTLQVELMPNTTLFKICIRDNGTGIPKHHLTNVYDEFYTTKPAGEGTGLGLWIAKQTVERNRGSIRLESEENEYTQVLIELPRGEPLKEASP